MIPGVFSGGALNVAAFAPEYTTRIALPLTYDEADYNGLLTWTRTGSGPHVTPQGFIGDSYTSRYVSSAAPAWLSTAATDLLMHASITMKPHVVGFGTGGSTYDWCVVAGPNSTSNAVKMALAIKRDPAVTTIPTLYARCNGQDRPLARRGWKYEGQFPLLSTGGFQARPQAFVFLDADYYLFTAHYEDTVSRCYKVATATGAVVGYFDFPSPYLHIASAALREDGTVWFSDYSTHKVLRVDVPASLTAGTAQIDGVYDTSVVTGAGSIEWARLGASNDEYLILADYQTAATIYLYLIPAATVILGNTFAVTDRYKRFVFEARCQGLAVHSGKAYSTHNRLLADASGNLGKMLRSDLSGQADSLADNGTLLYEATTYCPSGMPQDLDFHPTTGWCWMPTEGFQSVADYQGWLGLWSGPNDGTDVENHATLFYDDSAGTMEARVNNRPFGVAATGLFPVAVSRVSIGGAPTAAADFSNGFAAANIRNVVVSDPSAWWSDAAYQTAVQGYYETSTLTTHQVTLTNPGAESTTTGWTNEVGGIVNRATGPAPHSGASYFSGGSVAESKARQRLVITSATPLTTAEIDAGTVWARISWWQTSSSSDGIPGDQATAGLRLLNGTPTQLTESLAPLSYPLPTDTWIQRSHTVAVPTLSRNVDAIMRMFRVSGTVLQGNVDDIEVVFYKP